MATASASDEAILLAKKTTENLQQVRAKAPLVHSITNHVSMNFTANALLAIGASPVMAHSLDEVEEMVGNSQALILNIGTLDSSQIQSMLLALKCAEKNGVPAVLDPVGAGATRFRTDACVRIIETGSVAVIRANSSEILALAGREHTTKGVDSQAASQRAVDSAKTISRERGLVACISGEVDFVVSDSVIIGLRNGDPLMTKVTGMGCVATALAGAFLGAGVEPFAAAVSAMVVSGIAGELAALKSPLPGGFVASYLDALFKLNAETIAGRLRLEDL